MSSLVVTENISIIKWAMNKRELMKIPIVPMIKNIEEDSPPNLERTSRIF